MKSLTPLAVCAALSMVVAAQAPANFAGQWNEEVIAAPLSSGAPASRPDQGRLAVGDMGSGWGSPLQITQNARQLVVSQTLFSSYDAATQPRFVYALDGSESRNSVMISHTTQVRVSRAQWDGQALRITTRYPGMDPGTGKPVTTEVVHRLSLESADRMIVEVTRSAPLGGKPVTTRTVYQKK